MAKNRKRHDEDPNQVEQNKVQGTEAVAADIDDDDIGVDGASLEEQLNQLKLLAESKTIPNGPPIIPGKFLPHGKTRRPTKRKETEEERKTRARTVHIYQSYVNKSVLMARVVSVNSQFERRSDGTSFMHYYVVAMYGPYQVYIPVEKFTETSMEYILSIHQRRNPNMTLDQATERYLTARLGAVIPFIVTNIVPPDEEDGTLRVGGDRVEAMVRMRIRYWFATTTDNRIYRNVGDVINSVTVDEDDPDNLDVLRRSARVVAASASGIRVELDGVETFIQSRDLSWSMISDARTLYKVGDVVDLVIKSIDRKQEENLRDSTVTFTASVKETTENPRLKMINLFKENALEIGTISFIQVPTADRPNLRPRVFVRMDRTNGQMQCMCPFPNGDRAPEIGKKVNVRITAINSEKGQMVGIITHISD